MFSAGVIDAVPGIGVDAEVEASRAIMTRAGEIEAALARMHDARPVARNRDCRAMATILNIDYTGTWVRVVDRGTRDCRMQDGRDTRRIGLTVIRPCMIGSIRLGLGEFTRASIARSARTASIFYPRHTYVTLSYTSSMYAFHASHTSQEQPQIAVKL